jgi:hypothetical protein
LVEVGAAVDHALFVDRNAGGGAFELGQAFGDVELVEGGFGAGDGGAVVGSDGTSFDRGGTADLVELVDVHVSHLGDVAVGGNGGICAVVLVEFIPAQHDLAPA